MDDIVDPEYMKDLVLKMKWTHKRISEELRRKYPGLRGLSEMSVRRFCSKHSIHRTSRITDGELDVAVHNAVSKVGPTYGRKMIKGKLEAENIKVHDKRISASLTRMTPGYQQLRRQNTARLVNPVPYQADYFGQKLHLDQNEKLVMYGCTSVIAVDGYSNSILGIATMPIKNNFEIYRCVYRPIIIQHGLWDQLRVDCGKEFYLILHIQQSLANFRYNILRAPYIQTPSTKNHIAERKWVEVNSRINYPIKAHLNKMVEEELIDMRDDIHKYCVSWVTMQVVQAGVHELIPAWNYHNIPGKGRPIDLMMKDNRAVAIPETVIPTPENALLQYERSGGKLKSFGEFGKDPLSETPHLQEVRRKEFEKYPTFDKVFNGIVNNDPYLLRQSIQAMITITKRLAIQIV